MGHNDPGTVWEAPKLHTARRRWLAYESVKTGKKDELEFIVWITFD